MEIKAVKFRKNGFYLNIPDHFEPPVRKSRATLPEIESHRSGN